MSETNTVSTSPEQTDQIAQEGLINPILKYQLNQNNYLSLVWPLKSGDQFKQVKSYVMRFAKPNDLLAWKAIFGTIFYEVIAVYLICSQFKSLQFLGWVLHSFNTVRLFVQYHDMGHYSFFSSTRLNNIFGTMIGIFVHYPFQAWRNGHNFHHQIFGNLSLHDISQTILFTKNEYQSLLPKQKLKTRIFRQPIVFFFITCPLNWFIILVYAIIAKFGFRTSIFLQKMMSLVLYLIIFPLFGISALKMCLSMYSVQVFGTILFHLQHSVNQPYRQRFLDYNFSKAALEGSTFLKIPFFLKPFTNGIQYHHIHHLNTKVPSYLIEYCHNSFGQQTKQNWDKYNINKVSYLNSIKSLMNVMLNQETKMLETFSYRHL